MLHKFSPWACGRWQRLQTRPPSAGLQTEQLSPDKNISRLFLNIFKISVFSLWIFAWRSKVQVGQNITILDFFIYLYQARVDLLQTSCGPGLGQVWAWLSILLWNRLLIKQLSNINYQFLFGIERFTNLVALCEGNNGAWWKVHLAEQEVHGVENVWLQGATSLQLTLKTSRKETRWQECMKMAFKRNTVWEEKVEHQTFSEDS